MTPCIAEENNKKELELVRKQQIEARNVLQKLDLKHKVNSIKVYCEEYLIIDILIKELDVIVNKVKQFTVDLQADEDADEVADGEAESSTVQCVTCGIGLTVRNAIRHMERCFNKYESQTSFGSIFETKIEGNNMFCDFPSNGTFCKRLRVLCPEHCKDPKVCYSICFDFS